MNDILNQIEEIGIVPVIAIEDAEKAVPLAKALAEGGIPAAEVTFRTAAGEEAIRKIAQECPEIVLGAGTVLNIEQCDRALAAGAKYIVSPGYNQELVRYCVEKGVPVLPGCVNATEMTRAVNDGLKTVKFFPAEQSGGIGAIKALAPVFPTLRFMPTGGINTENLTEYLKNPKIIACGGTWMVKKDLIEGERYDEIRRISEQAVKMMLGFELMHVGINGDGAEDAAETAQRFEDAFGFKRKEGNSSDFAGQYVECMKGSGYGEKGHIGIGTYSIERAERYLKKKGYEFIEESRKTDGTGKTKAIYLKEEFKGFAVHLLKK